jgi:hypothetical protein
MGKSAPNVEAYREHEARRQAAQRALFEAQQGGSKFDQMLNAMGRAGVLTSRDGSASSRGLAALQQLKEQQRVARPEFDLQMTEQDIKEAQRLMEMERGYKDVMANDCQYSNIVRQRRWNGQQWIPTKELGWLTTGVLRDVMLREHRDDFEENGLEVHSRLLLKEMRSVILVGSRYEGVPNDDMVVSDAIVNQVLKFEANMGSIVA